MKWECKLGSESRPENALRFSIEVLLFAEVSFLGEENGNRQTKNKTKRRNKTVKVDKREARRDRTQPDRKRGLVRTLVCMN